MLLDLFAIGGAWNVANPEYLNLNLWRLKCCTINVLLYSIYYFEFLAVNTIPFRHQKERSYMAPQRTQLYGASDDGRFELDIKF